MKIRIRYLRCGEAVPQEMELIPEEYFDPLDEGEELDVRSVAKYDHAFEYTGHPAKELRWTTLEISDGESSWRVRTQFLNGQHAMMTHSTDAAGSEEIIHSTEIAPGSWHHIRTYRQAGKQWAVIMNSLTVLQKGQLTEDRNLRGPWSFEQLKEFGDVE